MSRKITLSRKGETQNKVAAIKALRSLSGLGLKEAKDAVESVMVGNDVVIEMPTNRLDQNGKTPSEETRTLLSNGIAISGAPSKKRAVLNATRSAAKIAVDDSEYELAISLIRVLSEHDTDV